MPMVPTVPTSSVQPGGSLGPKEPGIVDKGIDVITKIFSASAAASQAAAAQNYQLTAAAAAEAQRARNMQILIVGGVAVAALFLIMKD